MRKRVLCTLILISLSSLIWAQKSQASLKEVTGKVEIKIPGSDWKLAKSGTDISNDTIISTGFKSVALVAIGNSILTVKPLTRLTLQEIVQREGDESVSLYLLAGRVKAEVNPPIGGRIAFSVKSPTATASVRGTNFEFDAVNLSVDKGTVGLASSSGGPQTPVPQGQGSFVDQNGGVPPPVPGDLTPPALPQGVDPMFAAAALAGVRLPAYLKSRGTVTVSVGW